MRTRSFHSVMTFITFMLMLFGLASGCVSAPVSDQTSQSTTTTPNPVEETDTATDTAATEISADRQAELTVLAQEWIDTRDDNLIQQIQNEEELHFVGELLQQWQDESDTGSADTDPAPPPIAGCSGYWGTHRFDGKAELLVYGSGVYRYYWSPNCAMSAPGNDCGTDHNDNMVSFWMGSDYTYTEAEYKTDSSNWYTYWTLVLHGGGSYRVYTSNAYDPWYGNAYVCLSNTLDASTLRFGRRY